MEEARQRFLGTGDASAVLRSRVELVDEIVTGTWREILQPYFSTGMALVAVGGYGRRELFPNSDIDLLLLVEKAPQETGCRDALSSFLRHIWDHGLRLSHSVRTPQECSELHVRNIELNISLLDQRFLTGDRAIYVRLAERLPSFLAGQRQELMRHLTRLTRSRHAGFQNTIHHLEPNIKETPGGLRDLHLIWWLTKLKDQIEGAPTLPAALEAPRDLLHRLRCFLHFGAMRDQNLLSFEEQESFAEQKFHERRTPEGWMREYYRNARIIHRLALRLMEASEGASSSLLASFRDWRSRLSNSEFTVSRDRLYLRAPRQLGAEPELVLRLVRFIARHGVAAAPDTESWIEQYLPVIRAHFRRPQKLWYYLQEIFSQPNAVQATQFLHESGLLEALIPEWSRIDSLVVRDFFHRYTVDEHTILAIQNLIALRETKDPSLARFRDLLEEVESIPVLMLALLMHDIGKGAGEGRHAEESLALSDTAMQRMGVPEEDHETVAQLVALHLDLSSAMNSRDPDEPATGRYIADRVGTVELLKYLTLLTYADISAVNPSTMGPWRQEQLWRVYVAAHNELTRELDSDRFQAAPGDDPERAAFLEGLPIRYLRTQTPARIEAHLELEKASREKGVAVSITRQNGVYSLTLVTADRPGLFADIAGSLSSFGMNILKVEAFANSRGTIVDTFAFEDPGRTLELNPPELDRLQSTVTRAVLGQLDVKKLLANRPRPRIPSKGSRVRPNVHFNNEASDHSTLVEIVAEDRPGLLYDLTSALSEAGCNIEVVLIDTEAHKALDVFYVTRNGTKLTGEVQARLAEKLLSAC